MNALQWQSNRYWFRLITIIVIIAFLSQNMAWAVPTLQNHTLAPNSEFANIASRIDLEMAGIGQSFIHWIKTANIQTIPQLRNLLKRNIQIRKDLFRFDINTILYTNKIELISPHFTLTFLDAKQSLKKGIYHIPGTDIRMHLYKHPHLLSPPNDTPQPLLTGDIWKIGDLHRVEQRLNLLEGKGPFSTPQRFSHALMNLLKLPPQDFIPDKLKNKLEELNMGKKIKYYSFDSLKKLKRFCRWNWMNPDRIIVIKLILPGKYGKRLIITAIRFGELKEILKKKEEIGEGIIGRGENLLLINRYFNLKDCVAKGEGISLNPAWQGKGLGKEFFNLFIKRLTESGFGGYKYRAYIENPRLFSMFYRDMGARIDTTNIGQMQVFIQRLRRLNIQEVTDKTAEFQKDLSGKARWFLKFIIEMYQNRLEIDWKYLRTPIEGTIPMYATVTPEGSNSIFYSYIQSIPWLPQRYKDEMIEKLKVCNLPWWFVKIILKYDLLGRYRKYYEFFYHKFIEEKSDYTESQRGEAITRYMLRKLINDVFFIAIHEDIFRRHWFPRDRTVKNLDLGSNMCAYTNCLEWIFDSLGLESEHIFVEWKKGFIEYDGMYTAPWHIKVFGLNRCKPVHADIHDFLKAKVEGYEEVQGNYHVISMYHPDISFLKEKNKNQIRQIAEAGYRALSDKDGGIFIMSLHGFEHRENYVDGRTETTNFDDVLEVMRSAGFDMVETVENPYFVEEDNPLDILWEALYWGDNHFEAKSFGNLGPRIIIGRKLGISRDSTPILKEIEIFRGKVVYSLNTLLENRINDGKGLGQLKSLIEHTKGRVFFYAGEDCIADPDYGFLKESLVTKDNITDKVGKEEIVVFMLNKEHIEHLGIDKLKLVGNQFIVPIEGDRDVGNDIFLGLEIIRNEDQRFIRESGFWIVSKVKQPSDTSKPYGALKDIGPELNAETLQELKDREQGWRELAQKEKASQLLLEECVKKSYALSSEWSNLGSVAQKIRNISRLQFAVPIGVLKGAGDFTLALKKMKMLGRGNTVFELIIYDLEDEWRGEDLINLLDLPKNIRVYTITKKQVEDSKDMVGRMLSLKKLLQELYPLRDKEYLMITTDMVEKDTADMVKERLSAVLERNISVRVVVKHDNISVISLSRILSDWLKDIGKELVSSIKIILPVPISPQELKKHLEEEMRSLWEFLRAA